MKVIIAGGGTGGHVFPAISIAEEILKRNAENKVLFVGTEKGLERKLLSKRDYPIEFISSRGIKGKGFIESFRSIASALKGLLDSLRILKRYKPDLVLGVGGYVSGPVVLAASLLSIPTAICEQNSVPGITNRVLSRFVKRVFASFEDNVRFFPQKKTIVVGNPVRNKILINKEYSQEQNGFTILVFGGSQGSHKLNLIVPRAFGTLRRNDVFLIHQTGEEDLEDVKRAYEWYEVPADVLPFIEDIGAVYKSANLVIGRAGAGTVAEITALGKPAILVPYPFATYNHQLENAKVLEKAGAAILIEEKDAAPERLSDILKDLLNKDKLKEMGHRAKILGKPYAAQRIVDEIDRLTGVS
ncbi:MAG: undecaprenyldiphospho-muramoylpentapeptide beta-N-acetylglucosaminyltransferase [Candidatus Dadabacteria bacterium]|nr:undecaprenyldiphospho-muramoylpentapeptide beta-N-acetylglucosaminyltransferase [Candidatus Dadabacteria bacterium]